jgi:hypothetical protein
MENGLAVTPNIPEVILKAPPMEHDVEKIEKRDEFRICPSCGYRDGFHSMFRKQGKITRWLFICPSCHKIFDIGMTV